MLESIKVNKKAIYDYVTYSDSYEIYLLEDNNGNIVIFVVCITDEKLKMFIINSDDAIIDTEQINLCKVKIIIHLKYNHKFDDVEADKIDVNTYAVQIHAHGDDENYVYTGTHRLTVVMNDEHSDIAEIKEWYRD